MAPALEGVCLYESLISGRVTLLDVLRINEGLEVRAENVKKTRRHG